MSEKQKPYQEKMSRREFLAKGSLVLGGAIAAGYSLNRLFNLAREETQGNTSKELVTEFLSLPPEVKARFQNEVLLPLLEKPSPEEIDAAFNYFEELPLTISKEEDNTVLYDAKMSEGWEAHCAVAFDPDAIEEGNHNLHLEGTPPREFHPEYLGRTDNPDAPTIIVGEPNQSGFDSATPALSHGMFESMHGKGIAAVTAVDTLKRKFPEEEIALNLSGYSGGANAALVLVTHHPESIQQLTLSSSSYDMFNPQFREIAEQSVFDEKAIGQAALWVGEENMRILLNGLKQESETMRRATLDANIARLRKLLIKTSPYYWVDKVPPNSFQLQVVHGRNDSIAPFSQSTELIKKLVELGWDEEHLQHFAHEGGHFLLPQDQDTLEEQPIR